MQPLVSVLMTSYNREKYIGEAIESVCASTYGNLELIIVDDCSKDGTVEIARRYAEQDDRIRVYVNEANLKDYPNRNKAATYARGKYIKYVDADDYLYPWGLEILVRMMEQFPEAGWGLCSLIQVAERPYPFMLSPAEAYRHHYRGPGLFHKAPLSSIIKTEAFNAVGGFRPLRMVGDFDMWHRLGRQFPVVLMPDGIVWYREHSEQESKQLDEFSHQYERLRHEHLGSAECPLDSQERQQVIDARKSFLIKDMLYRLGRLEFVKARDRYALWKVYAK